MLVVFDFQLEKTIGGLVRLALNVLVTLAFACFSEGSIPLPPEPVAVLVCALTVLPILCVVFSVEVVGRKRRTLIRQLNHCRHGLGPKLGFVIPALSCVELGSDIQRRVLSLPEVGTVAESHISIRVSTLVC